MRYRATRPFAFTGEDGQRMVIPPGEGVPGFERMPSGVRLCHLRIGSVVDTEALSITMQGGQMVMQRMNAALYPKTATAPVAAEPVLTAPAAAIEGPTLDLHLCEHCDHKGFGNKDSLRKHVARKHAL